METDRTSHKHKITSLVMRKPVLPYVNNKGSDQPAHPQNIGSTNFTRLYSSLCSHTTSRERHKMHTPYSDTGVLQTCCVLRLRRQCIKVRAHKMHMQSKKNKFCMQYCKPRYLSITNTNYKRFRSKNEHEPPHDKTNKMACAPSENSDRFTDTSAPLPPRPLVTSAPSRLGPNHLGPRHLGPSHFGSTVISAPSHLGPLSHGPHFFYFE